MIIFTFKCLKYIVIQYNMKIKFSFLPLLFAIIAIVFSSCNNEPGPWTPIVYNTIANGAPGIVLPLKSNGYGIASNITVYIDSVTQYKRTAASGCFGNDSGKMNYKNIGQVLVNDVALTIYPNNCYTSNTGDGLDNVFDFTGKAIWKVNYSNVLTGNVDAGVFPTTPIIVTKAEIDLDTTNIIQNFPVTNADTIIYAIGNGAGKFILKGKSKTSTSCAFTKEELASIGATSNGLIQVSAYKRIKITPAGKPEVFYFYNNTAYVKQNVSIK
jgi:hypothetical protein